MFHHRGRLDHLLAPNAYSNPAFFEREQNEIFDHSWHFVAIASELASPGDYVATDVRGVPVVCRNADGQLRAFRNTCLHRHTRIVPPGRGSGERLRCQYHGWEYGSEGRIAKIPDGASFKGLHAKEWCLKQYPVATLGALVFVNLRDRAEDLRTSLGTLSEELDHFFGDHRVVSRWTAEFPMNWKVAVENAVESYHVPLLHPRTFKDFKDEVHHDHTLHPAFTSYLDAAPLTDSLVDRGFKAFNRLTTRTTRFDRAKHVNVFPNHLFYYREVYSVYSTVEPLAPDRTRFTMLGLLPRRSTLPLIGWAIQTVLGRYLDREVRKIFEEDIAIWTESHIGLKSSDTPGVLSRREERVYEFQRFVAERVGTSAGAERFEDAARREQG